MIQSCRQLDRFHQSFVRCFFMFSGVTLVYYRLDFVYFVLGLPFKNGGRLYGRITSKPLKLIVFNKINMKMVYLIKKS